MVPRVGNQSGRRKRMIRNLKAPGLALMAVFALTAMAASTASAQQGTLTSDGPVTLIGTETGEPNDNSISMFGTTIRCPGSTHTAHHSNGSPHTTIRAKCLEWGPQQSI